MDCLWGNNIDWMISRQPEVDCNKRCINNNQCGGYTAYNSTKYPNRCYFKNKSCKNNLFHLQQRTVTLLQGNMFKHRRENPTPKGVEYLFKGVDGFR